jgi:hypothetical protein
MALVREDNDRHLRRIAAEAILWQEMLERLVEMKQEAFPSDSDVVLPSATETGSSAPEALVNMPPSTPISTRSKDCSNLQKATIKLAQREC